MLVLKSREMAQQLRVLIALPEDLGSVCSIPDPGL